MPGTRVVISHGPTSRARVWTALTLFSSRIQIFNILFIGDVVCAIIERDGRFLIARRPAGKHLARKWEFPGGKVEAGESETEALERELLEELGVRVEILERLTPVEHSYPDRSLRLIAFRCRIVDGVPNAGEHDELRWIAIDESHNYDFPEADLPIFAEYRQKKACPPDAHDVSSGMA